MAPLYKMVAMNKSQPALLADQLRASPLAAIVNWEPSSTEPTKAGTMPARGVGA